MLYRLYRVGVLFENISLIVIKVKYIFGLWDFKKKILLFFGKIEDIFFGVYICI